MSKLKKAYYLTRNTPAGAARLVLFLRYGKFGTRRKEEKLKRKQEKKNKKSDDR